MTDQTKSIDQVFWEALQIENAEERGAFLDQQCGGNQQLREMVEELIAAQPKAGNFLEGLFQNQLTEIRPVTEQPGDTIGPYKLLQQIGEGGMGVVYMAEQTEPVERRVALKIIKPGMDTQQVIARFEAERQALAMMDHPNIAKVLDAGTTDSGRPYFVMELVKGMPVTKYCDEQHLTPRERLELFVPICQAVQHAHQKGIIHRDLKPSNVLIAQFDNKPVPKIIDFGVAKATSQKLTEKTMFTHYGQIVGTFEYMSPEQAHFNQLDVDTRSDIYSLGVLLYELLTGETPFDKKRLRSAAFDELLRIIREEEPPRPSTKLSSSAALANTAVNRKTEPKKLSLLIRGELDWIVMKALEKDRGRRYETATGFANDIQHYLNDEPVTACPQSAGYRFRKFARRNKAVIGTTAAIALSLLAGIAGTTWGLIEAKRQAGIAIAALNDKELARRAEAERAEGERQAKEKAQRATEAERQAKLAAEEAAKKEELANARAQKRLSQIEKANDILTSIFSNLNPEEIAESKRPLQAVLVENLDRAVKELEGESIGDPLVVASMQYRLGLSLLGLGAPNKAIVLFEKSVATRQAELGADDNFTLNSRNGLALAYKKAGKLDKAIRLFEETLKLQKARRGADYPSTPTTMNNLASAYVIAGKLDRALPLFEETLRLRRANLAPDDEAVLTSMNNLAYAYRAAGQLDLALPLFEKTLKLRQAKLGPMHPDTLMSMNNLASALSSTGNLERALPLFEESFKRCQAVLGREHPQTLNNMNNLAAAYVTAGKLNLGLPLFEETVQLRTAKLGREHPSTLDTMHHLSYAYYAAGKLDEALSLAKETLELRKAKLGPEHPSTVSSMARVGSFLLDKGAFAEAEPVLRECLTIREKTMPDSWLTFNAKTMLGGALLGQQKYAEAEPLLLDGYNGLKEREATLPSNSKARLSEALGRLVTLYESTGNAEEAARWRERLEARQRDEDAELKSE